MEQFMIELNEVSFQYEKDTPILKNITFHAEAKESIGIIGANGMGKSTLLKLLIGLCTEYEGSIQVAGIPVTKKNLIEIRKKIGYVFQDSDNQLFMSKVWDDIAFGPKNYGYSRQEVELRVENALKQVHMEHLAEKQIHKLSGGQKKLVSIATILALTPDIILMDEPTIALDPRNRKNLIHLLNQLEQLKIIATHDLDMILDTCERTILINQGEIIRDGNTEEILSDKKLLEENGLELPLSFTYTSEISAMRQLTMYRDIEISEKQIENGQVKDARAVLTELREN